MTAERGPRGRLQLSVVNGLAEITFGAPGSAFQVNARFAEVFRASCTEIATSGSVRALLVRSNAPDFCVGGVEIQDFVGDPERFQIASSLASVPQPVVVAVHGDVLNQGLELALAGDIRIADRSARFGDQRVVSGTLPFDGCTQRLPRLVGPGLATDMLLTGRMLTAQEAHDAGLVVRLTETREQLIETAYRVASEIAARGAVAARYVKEAVSAARDLPLRDGMRLEADLSFLLHGTPERAEGLAAFRERREPRMRNVAPETGS